MKKYLFAYTLMLTIILTGCTEDWLKSEPLSLYTPEITFTDGEGLDAALRVCLNSHRHEWQSFNSPICTENFMSDQGIHARESQYADLPLNILPDANLSRGIVKMMWFWTEGFRRIKAANVVISRIDDVDWESEAERNNILGKAYFHRAHTYYRLTHQFGDVPLILEEITGPRLDFYSCTRESILRKSKKDLEFAATWVKSEAEGARIGDINKATVNHILTKVNLALNEFDDAITSSSAIIEDGYHYLMTERFGSDKNDPTLDVWWDLHKDGNKELPENRERIFLLVNHPQYLEGNASRIMETMKTYVPFWAWGGVIKTPTGHNGISDQPLGTKIGNNSVEIDIVTPYGRGLGAYRPTPYFQFEIWTDNNDIRHKYPNWITMEDLVYNNPYLKEINDPYYGKPLQKFDDDGNLLASDTMTAWYNWQNKAYIPSPEDPRPPGGAGSLYGFRLAETYLLRAEAYFWKGDLINAANDINAVRARVNANPLNSMEVNIGTILDERARELWYEEPRKTEITRMAYIFAQTGKPSYNGKTYNLNNFSEENFWYDRLIEKNVFYRDNIEYNGRIYRLAPWLVLWPIPASTINANSLGRINQNKGYPGAENNEAPWVWVDGEGEGEIVAP